MRLLTAVSLVRVQQGEFWLHGQAVKTPPFHGGNRGSNPLGVIKIIKCGFLWLDSDIWCIIHQKALYADVAQLAEQLICNQQVIGSSPIIGFLDLLLSWLEQPAHNRSVLGSSP